MLRAVKKSGSADSTRFQLGIIGLAQRIAEIFAGRRADAADECGHGHFLLVPVIFQAIDCGVRGVKAHRVLGLAHVGAEQGVKRSAIQLDALSGHGAEDGFGDVDRHFVQSLFRIARGKFLVLVIVIFRKVHLADAFRARQLRKTSASSPTSTPQSDGIRARRMMSWSRRISPAERVAEGVHVNEEGMLADDADEGANQRA